MARAGTATRGSSNADRSLLDGADELLDSTTTIGDELKKEEPNKTTIKGVLAGIAEAATSIKAVTVAVTALRVALGF